VDQAPERLQLAPFLNHIVTEGTIGKNPGSIWYKSVKFIV